jgi:hypothetical protein
LSEARPSSFPQNLPFELGEYSQQARHRATGWRSQIQSLGQRNETDTKMFEFLQRRQQIGNRATPPIQPPDQH